MWFVDRRFHTEANATATAQTFNTLFQAEYASLIAVCDSTNKADEEGRMPGNPKVLVIQHGTRASIQDGLPGSWQPTSPGDVSVIVCLGRQHIEPIETCLDGTTPDLSTLERAITPKLKRYVIEVTVYDVADSHIVRRDMLWGDDPPVCAGVDAQQSVTDDMLYGMDIPSDDILNWLMGLIGSP